MIDFIRNVGIAFAVLGVIIVIHELGHFVVAKFFKIKVETFSVGFGPRLFGYKYGDTDYRVSGFPLGGYVKMAGETPGDTVTGAPNEFLSKPKWQRFLVASAGPAMNMVLAVGLLTGLFMYGTEVPEFSEGAAVVGTVETNSPAEAAGIQPGDQIVAIAGKERPNWEEVEARVVTNAGQTVPVVLNRNGRTIETSLTPEKQGKYEAGYAGIGPKIRVTNIIGNVVPGMPADAAGMKRGDEIVAVNGIDLKTTDRGVSEIIQGVTENTFPLTVLRKREDCAATGSTGTSLDTRTPLLGGGQCSETMQISVTPVLQDGRRMIGVNFEVPTIIVKESFVGSFRRSINQNVEYGTLIFQVLGKLVRRETSMKSVDGPIGIMRATSEFYEAGFGPLLMLMSMISLNLGLMNLLPIPILDGGVMMLLIIESVMGHDLSLTLRERIVQISFVFLLTLMVFVLYNDVVKLLPSGQPGP